MQKNQELRVKVDIEKCKYTGTINSITSEKNPYLKVAKEIAEENNIPNWAISQTKILANGKQITFVFRWHIEIETPDEEKNEIIAYIGYLTKGKDYLLCEAFVKYSGSDGEIYKTNIYDEEELNNDYSYSNAIKVEEDKEVEYINSLNIDFDKRYGAALFKLFNEHELKATKEKVSNFLKLDEVKTFILAECAESLTDTSPKEVLLEMFEDNFPIQY